MKITAQFKMILLVFVMTMTPALSSAAVNDSIPGVTPITMDQATADSMIERLKEIKKMDKSNLNRLEKKELRKEVKYIKSSLQAAGKGVYLSVGAIIIIVLLLILLI